MYEKRTLTEVRTFVVKVYCDCGGELKFNGHANMTYPPQYVHACGDCGLTTVYQDQYPLTTTQEVGEPTVLQDENSS